jgi:hypothetical protein
MVVFLSGKQSSCGRRRIFGPDYLSGKKCQADVVDRPKVLIFVPDFFGGKKWSSSRWRPKVQILAGVIIKM